MKSKTDLSKLTSKLEKVEKELSKCRTSTIEDGWQTQRHAKKSRKWDILAQEKMKLLQEIEDFKDYEIIKKHEKI
jgi:allantoicase